MALFVIREVLFAFPTQLSVGLQNINSTNKFPSHIEHGAFKLFKCMFPGFNSE